MSSAQMSANTSKLRLGVAPRGTRFPGFQHCGFIGHRRLHEPNAPSNRMARWWMPTLVCPNSEVDTHCGKPDKKLPEIKGDSAFPHNFVQSPPSCPRLSRGIHAFAAMTTFDFSASGNGSEHMKLCGLVQKFPRGLRRGMEGISNTPLAPVPRSARNRRHPIRSGMARRCQARGHVRCRPPHHRP